MRSARPHSRPGIMAIAFTAAVVLAVASSLSAQTVPESGPMFAPPDRQLLGMLDSSRELLDQGRYSEAVRTLATILEAEDDYFFMAAAQADDPTAGRQYRSFKNEARSILSGMPSAAQEAYELQFGAIARKLLDDALAEGDLEQALEVQRRYFGTRCRLRGKVSVGLLCSDSRPVLDGDATLPKTPVQQSGGAVRTGTVAEAGDLLAAGGRAGSSEAGAGRVAEAISPGSIRRSAGDPWNCFGVRRTRSTGCGRSPVSLRPRIGRRAQRGRCFATIRLVKVAAAAVPTCSRNPSGDRRSPTVSNWS